MLVCIICICENHQNKRKQKQKEQKNKKCKYTDATTSPASVSWLPTTKPSAVIGYGCCGGERLKVNSEVVTHAKALTSNYPPAGLQLVVDHCSLTHSHTHRRRYLDTWRKTHNAVSSLTLPNLTLPAHIKLI